MAKGKMMTALKTLKERGNAASPMAPGKAEVGVDLPKQLRGMVKKKIATK